jgi:hypothetical protein
VCGDVIELCPLDVNEAASSTAVNEGLCASLDHGIHLLNLYLYHEGHQSQVVLCWAGPGLGLAFKGLGLSKWRAQPTKQAWAGPG